MSIQQFVDELDIYTRTYRVLLIVTGILVVVSLFLSDKVFSGEENQHTTNVIPEQEEVVRSAAFGKNTITIIQSIPGCDDD